MKHLMNENDVCTRCHKRAAELAQAKNPAPCEVAWPKFKLAHERECAGAVNWQRTPSDLRQHLIRCANRWPTCPKHGEDLQIVPTHNASTTFLACPDREQVFRWAFHDEED